MKRQILKSLSTLCVSAMALFATSSLVVSCYDDDALWDAVEDVQGEVDELSKTIADVKAKLEALTSRVDALYTLKFQVTTENELQYSFDGGTTWVSTGIDLAEECACPEVTLVDNGDSVTISVGEQSYTIEKPEVVKFEILSGKQFFDYDETKEIVLSAKGIQSVFVAKTPRGWSVEADTKTLTVTAPAETASAAQSGVVEVWGASEDGSIVIGTLGVIVSDAPAVISMKGDVVVFTINEDPDYGIPYQVFYGVSKAENFEAEAKAAADLITSQADAMWEMNSNWNNEAEIEVPIDELLGEEAVAGTSYVIWAVSPTIERQGWSQIMKASVSDFIKYYYNPTEVIIEYLPSWNDIELSVEVLGADEYLAGYVPCDDYFDPEYFDIYEYLTATPGVGWGGPAGMFQYYTEKWEGSLKDFCSPDYQNMVNPDTEYFVFVLPMDPLKSVEDYTNEDVTTMTIKSNALQPGGSATATLDVTAENAVKPTELRPVVKTDAAVSYFEWFDAEKLALYADDELLIDYILNESYYCSMTDEAEFQAPKMNCTPETEYTLVLVLVDKDGKYSLQKEVVKTSALPLTDEIAVTFDDENCVVGSNSVVLKLVLDGEFEKLVFWKTEPNEYYQPTASEFESKVCSTDSWYAYEYVSPSELVDGTYTFEVDPETDYTFFVMGYTADKKYSHADSFSCRPILEIGTVKTEGFAVAPTAVYNAPEYSSAEYPEGYAYYYNDDYYVQYGYDGSYTVNPNGVSNLRAYVVDANDTNYGYDWKTMTAADKVKKMLLEFWCNEPTAEATFDKNLYENMWSPDGEWLNVVDPVIVLVWQEEDGTYCLMEKSFADELATMRADLHQKRADEIIDNHQWHFNWADMGDAPSALDFGVTQEGQFGIIYDAAAVYGADNLPAEMLGKYMWYMGWAYEVKATDATSGVINVTTVDHFGDTQTSTIATYSDLVSTTAKFTSEMLYLEDVEIEMASKTVPVYIEQGGIMM